MNCPERGRESLGDRAARAVYDIAGAWDATQHTRRSGDDDHSGMSGELSRPDSSLIWIKAAEVSGLRQKGHGYFGWKGAEGGEEERMNSELCLSERATRQIEIVFLNFA